MRETPLVRQPDSKSGAQCTPSYDTRLPSKRGTRHQLTRSVGSTPTSLAIIELTPRSKRGLSAE